MKNFPTQMSGCGKAKAHLKAHPCRLNRSKLSLTERFGQGTFQGLEPIRPVPVETFPKPAFFQRS
jgi:hypothetical protein